MADFLVKAKDKAGNYLATEVSADSESTAARFLITKGYFPISIELKEKGYTFIEQLLPFTGRVTVKDKVIFARQLATMINAGLPLVQSLSTLAEQTRNKKFKVIIARIASSVEGGQSLAQSLRGYADVFSPLFISLVKSGEDSGSLDKVFIRLADQMEKDYGLLSKIRNAMIYPSFVIGLVIVIMVFMTIFVIPQFTDFYSSINADLPAPTVFLLNFSNFLTKFWWLMIVAVIAGAYSLRRFLKSDKGRAFWDPLKLKMPFVNTLLKMIYMARFSRTFGTLIGAGVPVLDALSIVSESINNEVYKKAVVDLATEVKRGVSISSHLKTNPNFPPLVSQMIAVGEQTGELDNILNKLADFYDAEIDNLTKNLSSLVEPIMIIVVGVMVFGFILAILLPVYGIVFRFAQPGATI